MDFEFKIFGVPHVFDLYQGNENEISYFQTFYDASKENTKLIIQRRANGQVVYSYHKYNLISSSGRTNSFFGMAVVFNGEYCSDVESLYELFDAVYKTILQNGFLFEEIKGNPNAQAKYLVQTFAEAENEVKRIKNTVSKNILSIFSNDIQKINFPPVKTDVIKKLNLKNRNSDINNALRDYSWVSISPEYPDNDRITEELSLSPKIIEEFKTLNEKIVAIQKQLDELKTVLANKSAPNSSEIIVSSNTTKHQKDPSFGLKLVWKYAAIFLVISIIIGVVLWCIKFNKVDKFPDTAQYVTLINSGDSLLALTPPEYDAAIIKYKDAKKLTVANNQAFPKIEEANKMAIDELKEQARAAFERTDSKKIDNYNEAKNILKKAKDYNGNLDSDIANYGSETIRYYTTEISKTKDSNKEYAEYILDICKVTYNSKDWTVEELFNQLKRDLADINRNNGEFISKGCDAILILPTECIGKYQDRVEKLKHDALNKKI